MNTQIERLRAARALIASRERWSQGEEALDLTGLAVSPEHPNACCWCAHGAGAKFGVDMEHVEKAAVALFDASVVNVNDGFGFEEAEDSEAECHANILKCFDFAIAQLESAVRH